MWCVAREVHDSDLCLIDSKSRYTNAAPCVRDLNLFLGRAMGSSTPLGITHLRILSVVNLGRPPVALFII
eukprot:3676260-Alexandrium_andersonii.AAC.1